MTSQDPLVRHLAPRPGGGFNYGSNPKTFIYTADISTLPAVEELYHWILQMKPGRYASMNKDTRDFEMEIEVEELILAIFEKRMPQNVVAKLKHEIKLNKQKLSSASTRPSSTP